MYYCNWFSPELSSKEKKAIAKKQQRVAQLKEKKVRQKAEARVRTASKEEGESNTDDNTSSRDQERSDKM